MPNRLIGTVVTVLADETTLRAIEPVVGLGWVGVVGREHLEGLLDLAAGFGKGSTIGPVGGIDAAPSDRGRL